MVASSRSCRVNVGAISRLFCHRNTVWVSQIGGRAVYDDEISTQDVVVDVVSELSWQAKERGVALVALGA